MPEIGKEAKTFIDQGKLVPDETMIKFIKSELQKVHNQSWLLDGEFGSYLFAKNVQFANKEYIRLS